MLEIGNIAIKGFVGAGGNLALIFQNGNNTGWFLALQQLHTKVVVLVRELGTVDTLAGIECLLVDEELFVEEGGEEAKNKVSVA